MMVTADDKWFRTYLDDKFDGIDKKFDAIKSDIKDSIDSIDTKIHIEVQKKMTRYTPKKLFFAAVTGVGSALAWLFNEVINIRGH